jgi:excisionase family DNA binding protein
MMTKEDSPRLFFARRDIGEQPMPEPKYTLPTRVMTVREASSYLRIHPTTIYKLLRRGELPGFRIGSDWRFNVEEIDRYLKRPTGGGLEGGGHEGGGHEGGGGISGELNLSARHLLKPQD